MRFVMLESGIKQPCEVSGLHSAGAGDIAQPNTSSA